MMRHAHRSTIVNNKQGDRATATLFDWVFSIVPAWMGWSKAAGLDATEMFLPHLFPIPFAISQPNWAEASAHSPAQQRWPERRFNTLSTHINAHVTAVEQL